MPLVLKNKTHKLQRDYTIEPNLLINVLAEDNEVIKSRVLEAIDLVASGNVRMRTHFVLKRKSKGVAYEEAN